MLQSRHWRVIIQRAFQETSRISIKRSTLSNTVRNTRLNLGTMAKTPVDPETKALFDRLDAEATIVRIRRNYYSWEKISLNATHGDRKETRRTWIRARGTLSSRQSFTGAAGTAVEMHVVTVPLSLRMLERTPRRLKRLPDSRGYRSRRR